MKGVANTLSLRCRDVQFMAAGNALSDLTDLS